MRNAHLRHLREFLSEIPRKEGGNSMLHELLFSEREAAYGLILNFCDDDVLE